MVELGVLLAKHPDLFVKAFHSIFRPMRIIVPTHVMPSIPGT